MSKIRYIDSSDGSEHFYTEHSNRKNRMQGEEVQLQYARKKNGKYIAELYK